MLLSRQVYLTVKLGANDADAWSAEGQLTQYLCISKWNATFSTHNNC